MDDGYYWRIGRSINIVHWALGSLRLLHNFIKIKNKQLLVKKVRVEQYYKGGAVIHSGIRGSQQKYFVGRNWAYNINSSNGAQDETHRFAELCMKGAWHLLIKPIQGKSVAPGQEIKVWYPWRDFTITTYLSPENRKEHNRQIVRLKRTYPYIRKPP